MRRRRWGFGLCVLLLGFLVAAPGYGWAANAPDPGSQNGQGKGKVSVQGDDWAACLGRLGRHAFGVSASGREFDSEAGWLGIVVAEVSREKAKAANLPRAQGVLVEHVLDSGPGAKAGLKSGDIITRYNGQEVGGVLEFMRLVRETPPGRTTEIVIQREGKEEKLTAEVGRRQDAMPMHLPMHLLEPEAMDHAFRYLRWMGGWQKPMLGIEAENIHGQLGEYFQVPGGEGVLVEKVTAGSAAEKAGLKAGDVITAAGGKPVHAVGELHEQLRAGCGEKPVRLDVVRKGKAISLDAEISCPSPPNPSSPALPSE